MITGRRVWGSESLRACILEPPRVDRILADPDPERLGSAAFFGVEQGIAGDLRIPGCTRDFRGRDRSIGQDLPQPVLGMAPSRGVGGSLTSRRDLGGECHFGRDRPAALDPFVARTGAAVLNHETDDSPFAFPETFPPMTGYIIVPAMGFRSLWPVSGARRVEP